MMMIDVDDKKHLEFYHNFYSKQYSVFFFLKGIAHSSRQCLPVMTILHLKNGHEFLAGV